MLIKVTRTSAGCILGRFALGAPRLTAEQVGTSPHPELLNSCPSVLNSCPPILLSSYPSILLVHQPCHHGAQVGRRAAEELLEALEAGERWTSTSRCWCWCSELSL